MLLDELIQSSVIEAIPAIDVGVSGSVDSTTIITTSSSASIIVPIEESLPTASTEIPTTPIIRSIPITLESDVVLSTPTAADVIATTIPVVEYTESSLSDLPIDIIVPTSSEPVMITPTEPTVTVAISTPAETVTPPKIESSSIETVLGEVESLSNSVESEQVVAAPIVLETPALDMDTTTSDESKMDDDDESSALLTIVGGGVEAVVENSSTGELPKVDDNAMDVDESVEPMDQ